ncbi:MAG: GNAT family N-acetyltransferase [Armatimonadetes bacterium]|nr:GNAT family N-acetyltransferase [Armatimonadota bacterium]
MTSMERNQLAYVRALCETTGARFVQEDGAMVSYSNDPNGAASIYNCRFDPLTFQTQVNNVLRRCQEERQCANWSIGPSATPPGLAKFLRNNRRMMGPMYLPEMQMHLKDFEGPVPKNASLLKDWDTVKEEGFPGLFWVPRAGRAKYLETAKAIGKRPDIRLAIVHIDGVLTTSATMFMADGIAGIYDVVTKAEHRRKGGARAVLQLLLTTARDEGCHTAALISHKRSVSVYHHVGFRETGMFTSMYYSRTRMEEDAIQSGLR